MSATWTSPGWCPPAADGPRYYWTISFKPNDDYWSPQATLIGGPPAGVDLEALLRDWYRQRGGPAAEWRLQVSPVADEAEIVANATVTFTEAVERQVKRLGPKPRPVAPTFPTSTRLLPPSPEQLQAWKTRPEGPPAGWETGGG
jgi:hypothetical protein